MRNKVRFDALDADRSSVGSEHSAVINYEVPLRRGPILFIAAGLVVAVVIAAAVAVYLMMNASNNVQIFQLINSTNVLLNLTLTGVGCLQKEDNCIRPNSSLICEERGECKCGHCQCNAISEKTNYTGEFCECGECPISQNGTVCSNRGVCECGVCRCDPMYDGEACEDLLGSDIISNLSGTEFNSTRQDSRAKLLHPEKTKEHSQQHTV